MDPVDGMKWALGITAALGGGALGIKRLLTVWGKETAQSSGVSATNMVLDSMRKEIERDRTDLAYFAQQNRDAQIQIMEMQKQLTHLTAANHKLELNNTFLKGQLQTATASDKVSVDLTKHKPAFSDTNIGDIN